MAAQSLCSTEGGSSTLIVPLLLATMFHRTLSVSVVSPFRKTLQLNTQRAAAPHLNRAKLMHVHGKDCHRSRATTSPSIGIMVRPVKLNTFVLAALRSINSARLCIAEFGTTSAERSSSGSKSPAPWQHDYRVLSTMSPRTRQRLPRRNDFLQFNGGRLALRHRHRAQHIVGSEVSGQDSDVRGRARLHSA